MKARTFFCVFLAMFSMMRRSKIICITVFFNFVLYLYTPPISLNFISSLRRFYL
ncbi:unnamed protein product [Schistosoma mattheei]|uniref:Uncharacterized protein n=1 Tax=Schistosoma mattheei TaxID=31246 RepID=A0A183PJP2_9TREM|nr:unnamed protein product [Schistosoma mattheei]